ncbi:unnamed protein product, partial [Leptidea sinapis]
MDQESNFYKELYRLAINSLAKCVDFESSYELGTARLRITHVTAEDEGSYTCEATNTLGKATSCACLEGDTVVFQCAVAGLPPPWATWDKDGLIIIPSSRITIKEKDEMLRILQIEQVSIDDVGLYRISLENEYGRAEASARLEVISHKGKFYTG